MTPDEAEEHVTELLRELRCWETKVWMRHAESPTDIKCLDQCVFCKGTGRTHFCLIPKCVAGDTHECLHPTKNEADEYYYLQDQLKKVIEVMEETMQRSRGAEVIFSDVQDFTQDLQNRDEVIPKTGN